MQRLCVLVELENARILPITWNALTAARKIQQDVAFLCVSEFNKSITESISKKSKGEIIFCPGKQPESIARAVKDIKFTHLVAATSTTSRNLLPRIAALLDASPISNVVEIHDKNTFSRLIYAGNALLKLRSNQNIHVMDIRATAFPTAKDIEPTEPKTSTIECPESDLSEFIKQMPLKSEMDLATAQVVIAGGRALKSKENFNLMTKLAKKFKNSAVGASRAAVDAGYADNSLQIGQTGKIIAPQLYIGVGISGAIQHVAGMKDSKVIVAINNDAEAPIFDIADYGLVGDLFKIVPELIEKIK